MKQLAAAGEAVPARADAAPAASKAARPDRASNRRGGSSAEFRYMWFGQVLPAALFAVIGILAASNIAGEVRHPATAGWVGMLRGPVYQSLFVAFCLIPAVLFVVRRRPVSADPRILPRAVAFVATTMLLSLNVLPGGPTLATSPGWVAAVAAVAVVLAIAGAVWSLITLGLSFGIFPAVRRLITHGPYQLVRHPIYVCEIVCALTWVVVTVKLVPLLVVACFIALQVRRIGYEEAILGDTLPEWAAWAKGRARLIPGVW